VYVLYAWWFANTAQSDFTNAALRTESWAEANARLALNFDQDPCFRIDMTNGAQINTCP
jgi:hypothetical protein